MLTKLDPTWLIFAIVAVAMLSYLFSIGLSAMMRDAGFGVLGNAVLIIAGFFGAIYCANTYGRRLDMFDGVLVGLAGAFLLLLALVVLKAMLNRMV